MNLIQHDDNLSVISFLFIAAGIFFSACRHEPDPASLPKISFSARILPIIQSNCAKSGCHDGEEQFSLNNFEQIKNKVKSGNPHQSELYNNMIYLDDARVMPPPPDQPLTEEQLKLIYTWILQGAENN